MDIPHKNASLREWIEWLSEPTPTPSNAYFMALQFRDRMAWACPAIEDAARAASATDVAQAKPFAELSFLASDSASQEEPAGNLFLPLILSGALWAEPWGANELLMLLFKNPATLSDKTFIQHSFPRGENGIWELDKPAACLGLQILSWALPRPSLTICR